MFAFGTDYRLVYDLQQSGYQHWWLMAVGLVFIFAGLVTVVIQIRSSRAKLNLWPLVTPVCASLFGFLWIGVCYLNYSLYAELRDAVRDGKSKVVEGRVTQFVPMPYEGHAQESFVVGEKSFSYSDYNLTKGFNQTKSHGGPMHEGLQVRIAYVGDSIVRLEVAE